MLKASLPAVAAFILIAHAASAATVDISVDTNNTIPNVVANSVMADGEGIDWGSIVVRVDLTSGSVYNGVPDSNAPQSAFWNVPGFEILQWDTWFGVPGDNTNGIAGCAGDLGGCFDLPQPDLSVTAFNTKTTDTGPTRVANISLSADAQGTWQMINAFDGGVLVWTEGAVINGVMVPEPASLGLLGLGVLGLYGRPTNKRKHTC